MKYLFAILVCTLALCGVTSAFAAPPARTVCQANYDQGLRQAGWVVVKVSSDWWRCGGLPFLDTKNVYTIVPAPTGKTTVCAVFSLPPNFVVIAQGSSQDCEGPTLTILPLDATRLAQSVPCQAPDGTSASVINSAPACQRSLFLLVSSSSITD